MNNLLTSLAAGMARKWVAVYTLGLPPSVRDARRAELASDLWEQCHEIRSGTSNGLAGGVLARVIGGVPADVLWAINVRNDQGGTLAMRAFDGYRKADKAMIFGMAVIAAFLASTAIGATAPISLLIAAVVAVGLAGLMRLVFPPTATEQGGAMDSSATASRRRRLLATFAISIVVIVGIAVYVFSLEHWGGLAIFLNIVGTVALLVALGSLALFVADIIRGRRPTSTNV
jgi:hypothetical protein